jgi:hypothetical protein
MTNSAEAMKDQVTKQAPKSLKAEATKADVTQTVKAKELKQATAARTEGEPADPKRSQTPRSPLQRSSITSSSRPVITRSNANLTMAGGPGDLHYELPLRLQPLSHVGLARFASVVTLPAGR